MIVDKALVDAIRKRAYGFYYSEENIEYELTGGGKFLLCKNKKRVYFSSGFLTARLKKVFSKSARISVKVVKFFKKFGNEEQGFSKAQKTADRLVGKTLFRQKP